jgi:thioredoxin reductase
MAAALPQEVPKPNHTAQYDVIIVGAGASGIGVALSLAKTFGLDEDRVLIIERGESVGDTFKKWPKEMRFISPSFNSQGWTGSFDLNSVAFGTSPAYTLAAEHPTGEQYAQYLQALADVGGLNIRLNTEVTAIQKINPDNVKSSFAVDVKPTAGGPLETLKSRYVIWAAGEFQYPNSSAEVPEMFPGSSLCRHNSTVDSWKTMKGDDYIIIGGYESGIDACHNLSANGKRTTVVSSTACWRVATDDASTELAPHTVDRLRNACASPYPPRLLAPVRVFKVEKDESTNEYLVYGRWKAPVEHKGGKRRIRIMAPDGHAAPHRGHQHSHEDIENAVSDFVDGILSSSPEPSGKETDDAELARAKKLLEDCMDSDCDDSECSRHETLPDTDDKKKDVDVEMEEDEKDEGIEGKKDKIQAKEGMQVIRLSKDQIIEVPLDPNQEEKDSDEASVGPELGVQEDNFESEPEGTETILRTKEPPLLCTGFEGSVALGPVKELFEYGSGQGCADGAPILTLQDESTKCPGLFLCGPAVRHGDMVFCFVYKYRQRFGLVADAICQGLGMDTTDAVEKARETNMYLDDFETCKGACGESC